MISGILCACFVFLSSCTYKIEYRGEFGRELLPADREAVKYVSMAAFEASSRMYVRVPDSPDDERWRGQVLEFSIPDGRHLGVLRDGSGAEIHALRLTATPSGELGILSVPKGSDAGRGAAYEVSLYAPGGGFHGKTFLEPAFEGDGPTNPAALAFAVTETGSVVLVSGVPGKRGKTVLVEYESAFERPAAKPGRTVDLETFRSRIPVAAGESFTSASLQYANGSLFLTVDLADSPFDGVLVLDENFGFIRYVTGQWFFNCPISSATDRGGFLYVSNRWGENIDVHSGDRIVASSAKDNFFGDGGPLMNNPGALAIAGDDVFVYDGGNGRIARFSTILPGTNRELERLESYELPIVLKDGSDGGMKAWLMPFFIGFFAMTALHGFFTALTSRERIFFLFGLCNVAAMLFLIENFYARFFVDLVSSNYVFTGSWLVFTTYTYFGREYISVRKRSPAEDRVLAVVNIVAAAAYVVFLAFKIFEPDVRKYGITVAFDVIAVVIGAIVFAVLIRESVRGNREARVFLALDGALILTGSLSSGIFSGSILEGTVLDPAVSQGYPIVFGFLLSSLVVSMDLGTRMNAMKAARERARIELEGMKELDAQKTDFIMNVSHELRTPLAVILGVSERLKTNLRGDRREAIGSDIGIIERNARRLLKDIGNLLKLSRLGNGDTGPVKVKLSLSALLRQVCAEFSPVASSRGIEFRLELPDTELLVHADPEPIETAVLNLISNALKFTQPGGSVTIAASRSDGGRWVRIAVSDTGVGIGKEHLKNLFRRFFRADETKRRKHEGFGIGLSLVREAAERHGGRVEAESAPGEGSTFTLLLPYKPGAWENEEPARDPVPGGTIEGYRAELETNGDTVSVPGPEPVNKNAKTVLLVEDNVDLRNHMESIFREAFRVRTAANGAEALAVLDREIPDCIVSDIMMPEMDGLSFFSAVRKDSRWKTIPFLFLTARADPEEKLRSLRDGALDYIEKPFSTAELIARVESLIAWNRSVSTDLTTRIKNSIVDLIDGMGSNAARASRPDPVPFEYGRLFADKGLSERERDVAELMLAGMSDKEIAFRLHISVSTVGNHNTKIYRKLGISNRLELFRMHDRAAR